MDTYILLCTALELKNTDVAKLLLASSSKDNINTSSNSPLHFAILNDDIEIIQMFLDEGANAENFNGKTALHNAVERVKMEIIDPTNRSSKKIMNLLSSRGASVDDNGNDTVTSCHIAADTGKHCPPLHLAVDKGDEEITKLFLSKGANVNAKGSNDTTALHIATEKGHSKIVELLLKHGADVDAAYTSTFRKGYTSLHLAVENQHEQISRLLLNSGANVNVRGNDGTTSLHIATEKGYLQTVEYLLNAGVDVNSAYTSTIREGYTSLHLAAAKGDEEITKLLLSKGVDVNAKGRHDTTALHIATEKGDSRIVQLLLKHGGNVNSAYTSTFRKGYTLLHLAVENQHEQISRLLLNSGANVNVRGNDGTTSLHIATEKGYLQTVEYLLNAGVDVNSAYTSTIREGYTSLHLAAAKGDEEITKLLLSKGVDINAKGRHNTTALHIATEKGHSQIVQLLLKHGGNVNSAYTSTFRKGYTLLHLAVENQHEQISRLLLNSGANVNVRGNDGTTSLHIATEKGYLQTVEYLLNAGVDVNSAYTSTIREGYTSLHLAAAKGDEEITKLLLSKGVDVNAKGRHDTTALHIATEKGHSQIVQLLLKHGANVNSAYTSTFRKGYTSPHLAAEKGDEEITKLLLKGSANVNAELDRGITSLHIATERGHLHIVPHLLKHRAHVDSASWKVRTPLYLVVEKKHEEIVKLLLVCEPIVNAEDKDHIPILQFAVVRGNPTIIEHILKHFPDLNYESKTSALYGAIRGWEIGNEKIVKYLLRYGFTVDPEDAIFFMDTAVENGHLKLVEELLKHSTDVNMLCNAACKNGYKPLHIAIKHKQIAVVKLLIRYGADVNAKDETGKPPIFYATKNADLKIIKLLLTNKANVKDNPELLINAVREGHREIVEVLLQHGADVEGSDKYGRMPLHFVLDEARPSFEWRYPEINVKGEIAKLLLSWGANPNTRVHNCMPMLHAAIEKGYVKVVEALLEYDADVNATYKDMTPLYLTALIGNDEIVDMLVNKGANIIAPGTSPKSAFCLALNRGDTKVVELLLKCSGKTDTTICCDLWTSHLNEIIRCPDMLKLLLKFGANVNFADLECRSALHYAAREGYIDIVRFLLEHDADVTETTLDNYTALDFAMDGIKRCHANDTHNRYELYKYVNIAEILKYHMIKVKAADLYVINKHVLSISSDDEEQSDFLNESDEEISHVYCKKARQERRLARYVFQDECEKEVASMKSEKFVNTYITMYDILTEGVRQLTMYARNASIVEAFESGDYRRKFPIYASMINRNFRSGEERKEFLERGKKMFYSIFKNFPELPSVCTEKIFSYLCDFHVSVLINECKIIGLD